MAIYLDNTTIKDLIESRDKIFTLAKQVYEKYNIDILANDTLNALSIHEIVSHILLSPPYFDLEIYPSEDQSFTNYPDYRTWLVGYWEETVKLCANVMKPGAKFGFVISNYVNKNKQMTTISQDMCDIVKKHLQFEKQYRVQWSAIASTRQSKKTRNGNFEDLWLFTKK